MTDADTASTGSERRFLRASFRSRIARASTVDNRSSQYTTSIPHSPMLPSNLAANIRTFPACTPTDPSIWSGRPTTTTDTAFSLAVAATCPTGSPFLRSTTQSGRASVRVSSLTATPIRESPTSSARILECSFSTMVKEVEFLPVRKDGNHSG